MIPAPTHVWLVAEPIDMRTDIDGLSQRIQNILGRSPYGGTAYAIRNHRRASERNPSRRNHTENQWGSDRAIIVETTCSWASRPAGRHDFGMDLHAETTRLKATPEHTDWVAGTVQKHLLS